MLIFKLERSKVIVLLLDVSSFWIITCFKSLYWPGGI